MLGTSTSSFDPDAAPVDQGIYGLPTTCDEARLVLLSLPWEVTTSFRGGTSLGPEGIYKASFQVDLFDSDFGKPYEAGIALIDGDAKFNELRATARDAKQRGNHREVDACCERLNELVHRSVVGHRREGKIVGIIGGEHGVGLGAIRAVARDVGVLGILQIDAHADLRDGYQGFKYSHAAFMHNVLEQVPEIERTVQVAVRDCCPAEARRIQHDPRIKAFFDQDYGDELMQQIVDELPRNVWISFDIDALDPSLCPNTGTPVPGGLGWREAIRLLVALVNSGRKIVGFDLCEIAPTDGQRPLGEGWDEIVGARILYKLCGATLKTIES